MSRPYHSTSRKCTACSRPTAGVTPAGKYEKWTDEKGRCSKCVLLSKLTHEEFYAQQFPKAEEPTTEQVPAASCPSSSQEPSHQEGSFLATQVP